MKTPANLVYQDYVIIKLKNTTKPIDLLCWTRTFLYVFIFYMNFQDLGFLHLCKDCWALLSSQHTLTRNEIVNVVPCFYIYQ